MKDKKIKQQKIISLVLTLLIMIPALKVWGTWAVVVFHPPRGFALVGMTAFSELADIVLRILPAAPGLRCRKTAENLHKF